jgi:O-methyltransferase
MDSEKRKLVYACVFFNKGYIDVLKLFGISLKLFGDIQKNTDVLIMTSEDFKDEIQTYFNNISLPVKINILNLNTILESAYSRLLIFDYPEINNYDKILYLDTDILITNKLKNILDINLENKLYTLQEETISCKWHGSDFFDFSKYDKNITSFTSAILLFNNCEEIKNLFTKILKHIYQHLSENKPISCVLEQPFIVYNATIDNLYNNTELVGKAINLPESYKNETLCHFPGGTGDDIRKKNHMVSYLKYMLRIFDIKTQIPEFYPYEFVDKILKEGFSMLSKERLSNLYFQCKKFKTIECSFVECGVAKGGALALMKYIASDKNKVFGFDSFDGMPDVTEEDLGSYNKSCPLTGFGKVNDNLSGGIQNVYNTFSKLNLDMNNVILTKGFFQDTLEIKENVDNIGEIGILRLDGDWYESTKICLEKLYNKVIDGGVIIIDDYGHFIGAKRATDEFREKHNIKSQLIQTDYTEYYWIKDSKKETDTLEEIKYSENVNIFQDVWTLSDEFRVHLKDFFKDKSVKSIAEIGSYKGYTTRFFSELFEKVYAVDNNIEFHNLSKEFNKDKENIEYVTLDIYNDEWKDLESSIETIFIDAGHSYENCKSDAYNSLKQFINLNYVIFDDYGAWPGVKKIVDELILKGILLFDKYVGLYNVPGLNNIIFKNVSEGIITHVNPFVKNFINKTYKWDESGYITFSGGELYTTWGNGQYRILKDNFVEVSWMGFSHMIKFNEEFTNFVSIRTSDLNISIGR